MKRLILVLAGAVLAALLLVPLSAADTTLPTGTTLTSDQIDALGIAWDASLEDWSTALDPPSTMCIGLLEGTFQDVTVPKDGTCIIDKGTIILHDLTVLDGARLGDVGAYIGHDVRAKNPASIEIGGAGIGFPGTVGHDIHVQGVTSFANLEFPVFGAFNTGNFNFVCNQLVGHDVVVQKSVSTAGAWAIGDVGGNLSGCGNRIAHDLVVKDNANPVDISGNNPRGLMPTAGIGHDLKVANNSGGTTNNANDAVHDCTQSNNHPYTGADDNAGNNNNCNTAYP